MNISQPIEQTMNTLDIASPTPLPNGCNGSAPPATYRLITDAAGLSEVEQAVRLSERVAVDLETTGLDPHRDRVRLVEVATERDVFVIDAFSVDPSPLWPVMAGKELVLHNAAFDALFLQRMGLDTSTCILHDTMLLSALLTAGDYPPKNGLKDLAERHLGIILNKSHQKADWSGELSADQLAYAAQDARVTFDLYPPLTADIDTADLRAVADLEHRCLPTVLWMSNKGIGFDREAWLQVADKAEQEAERFHKRLNTLAPAKPLPDELCRLLVALGVKKPPKNPPKKPAKVKPADMVWNWNSREQVIAAFHLLGIKLKSTGEEELATVNHLLADALRRYRTATKRAGTYGRNWQDFIGDDGRIRCSWKQTGAKTGRMACSEPNLQNLPKDPAYRKCFTAPPGRVLIRADYSQIELRIVAKVAREQNMINAFQKGADLHTLTARQMVGREDITPQERQLAKPVNFGLIYGLGAAALAQKAKLEYGVDMSMEQAKQYREVFFRAWPDIRLWHGELQGKCRLQMHGGFTVVPFHYTAPAETRTLAGRRTITKYVRKEDGQEDIVWYGGQANYIVQGTGGDGIKGALTLLWERRCDCPHAFPVLAVHDEIVIECDEDKADKAENWLKSAMVDAMAPLIDPVPCEVEVKIGRTWGG